MTRKKSINSSFYIYSAMTLCMMVLVMVGAGQTIGASADPTGPVWSIVFRALIYIAMLTIAWTVLYRKRDWLPSLLFYGLVTGYVFFRMDPLPITGQLATMGFQSLYLFSFFLIPALFLHFWAEFPKQSFFFHHVPGRLWILYGPPLTLSIPAIAGNVYFSSDPEKSGIATGLILFQGICIWAIYLINGCLMGIRAYLRVRSRILNRRVLLVGATSIFAFIPFVITGILDYLSKPLPVGNTLLMETSLILPILALAFALDYGEDHEKGLPWLIGQMMANS